MVRIPDFFLFFLVPTDHCARVCIENADQQVDSAACLGRRNPAAIDAVPWQRSRVVRSLQVSLD